MFCCCLTPNEISRAHHVYVVLQQPALLLGRNDTNANSLLTVNLFCRMQKMFDILQEQTEMIKEISRRNEERSQREKDEVPKESGMRSLFGFP